MYLGGRTGLWKENGARKYGGSGAMGEASRPLVAAGLPHWDVLDVIVRQLGDDIDQFAELLQELADALIARRSAGNPAVVRVAGETGQTATIERERHRWTFTIGSSRASVPNRRGLEYLAQLLTNPGRPIKALELAGGGAAGDLAGPYVQPVLDEQARNAYRRRVAELNEQIAEADGDQRLAGELRHELDALLNELRRLTGKGGRARGFPDPGERARTAVRKAIKRALDEIAAADPGIGEVLASTVSTGATCCYRPCAKRPIRWTFKLRD